MTIFIILLFEPRPSTAGLARVVGHRVVRIALPRTGATYLFNSCSVSFMLGPEEELVTLELVICHEV